MTTPVSPRAGLLARLRTLLAGSRDPVDVQLAEIERQGATLARIAHLAAFALIILFSIGSLLGLSHSALTTLQQQWQTGHTIDIPSALAAAINGLLVLVMDTALLYAASMLRIIKARQSDGAGVHILVMIGVSVLEGTTWAYFSWLYDRPHDPIAWGLIVGRAVGAPLLSAYLSLARPIPIGPRDILYQAAMASGKGVIRDVTREANDREASLARKARLYRASEMMQPADRARLDALIDAAAEHEPAAPAQQPEGQEHPQLPAPSIPHFMPSLPISGDRMTRMGDNGLDPYPAQEPFNPVFTPTQDDERDHRAFTLNLLAPHARPLQGKPAPTRDEIKRRRLRAAKRILAENPDIGLRELTRQIAIATSYRISESTAHAIRDSLRDSSFAQREAEAKDKAKRGDQQTDPDPDDAA